MEMETQEYKGYRIKIHTDDDPNDPREWDNLGHMVCFHRRYDLGDCDHDLNSSMFNGWDDLEEYLRKEEGAHVIRPLYLYDHSGLRIKIGDFHGLLPQGHAEFDSGQVGFIYVTKKQIRNEFNVKRISKKATDKANKLLESEVSTYDDYLCGNIYGYEIEDKAGEELDSCWGFFGDYEKHMIPECKGIIDHHVIQDTFKEDVIAPVLM